MAMAIRSYPTETGLSPAGLMVETTVKPLGMSLGGSTRVTDADVEMLRLAVYGCGRTTELPAEARAITCRG